MEISLLLNEDFKQLHSEHNFSSAIEHAIAHSAGDQLMQLIPLSENLHVAISFANGISKPSFFIDQLPAYYPDALYNQVWFYIQKKHISENLAPQSITQLLKASNEAEYIHFLKLLTTEVIKHNRHILIETIDINKFENKIDSNSLRNHSFYGALKAMLQNGLSIKNIPLLAETFQSFDRTLYNNFFSEDEFTELLIDSCSKNVIEIYIAHDYLSTLSQSSDAGDKELFQLMKEGLFYELGIYYPEIKFIIDDDLPKNYFSVKLNDLLFLPIKGLEADELLANAKVHLLSGLHAFEIINPANSDICTVIKRYENPGSVFTWTPFGFMILAISSILRRHAYFFITESHNRKALGKLYALYPELVEEAPKLRSSSFITTVLRLLVKEEISIRPLNKILQKILDFDYIIADGSTNIVFDSRLTTPVRPDKSWLNNPVNICSYVRNHLKNYISFKYTRRQSTMIVYLVDPAIENMLRNSCAADEIRQIVEAFRAEMSHDSTEKHILTTNDIRPVLKNILQYEFPHINVLAYQELSPSVNIQPIARIVLS